MSETDAELRISAEAPGLDEMDMDVLLEDDLLALKGEKRSEHNDENRRFSKRFYGRFERRIPLGSEIDADNAAASFRNGVLTVTPPKRSGAKASVKRIAING